MWVCFCFLCVCVLVCACTCRWPKLLGLDPIPVAYRSATQSHLHLRPSTILNAHSITALTTHHHPELTPEIPPRPFASASPLDSDPCSPREHPPPSSINALLRPFCLPWEAQSLPLHLHPPPNATILCPARGSRNHPTCEFLSPSSPSPLSMPLNKYIYRPLRALLHPSDLVPRPDFAPSSTHSHSHPPPWAPSQSSPWGLTCGIP